MSKEECEENTKEISLGGSIDYRSTLCYFFGLHLPMLLDNDIVTQCTKEAEYVAATAAVNQVLWLEIFLLMYIWNKQKVPKCLWTANLAIYLFNR